MCYRSRTTALALLLSLCAPLACRSPQVPGVKAEPVVAVPPAASAESSPVALPPPVTTGRTSLEEALLMRRSRRAMAPDPLLLEELGQIAWAAQGITDRSLNYRTAPSAGALYPLEIYFATADGVTHYLPGSHALERVSATDVRSELARAAGDQPVVGAAACDVVITSVTARTRRKYDDRAKRFAILEAGHVGQNILLQATTLKLAAVPIGGFDEARVAALLHLPPTEEPLYVVALGRSR